MEENQVLKQCDLKLKKFIQKSIHRKQLANCHTLMPKKKLSLFYKQMQQHFYRQNLKKIKKQRRFSLGNEALINLEEKQYVKMVTQPEYFRPKPSIKPALPNQTFKLQSVLKKTKEALQSQKYLTKVGCQEEMNYFVRKVKNPKVVRYITLKPPKQSVRIPQIEKRNKIKSPVNKQKNENTNFEQRKILMSNFKKARKFRNSCIQF